MTTHSLGLKYKKEAKLMNEEERKIFVSIVEKMLKLDETPMSEKNLTELQETRRQALNLIYKKSTAARNYIDLCMTLYGRSVMEEKSDIMIDGMKKLYELIFGPDEKEEMSCTKRTEKKS